MAKVYIVYKCYNEWHGDSEPYNSEMAIGVFDCERKAIRRIQDSIMKDHEWIDTAYPNDKCVTKFNANYTYKEDVLFWSCTRYKIGDTNLGVSYRYQAYDVE